VDRSRALRRPTTFVVDGYSDSGLGNALALAPPHGIIFRRSNIPVGEHYWNFTGTCSFRDWGGNRIVVFQRAQLKHRRDNIEHKSRSRWKRSVAVIRVFPSRPPTISTAICAELQANTPDHNSKFCSWGPRRHESLL